MQYSIELDGGFYGDLMVSIQGGEDSQDPLSL